MDLKSLAALAVAEAGGEHPCDVIGHKWVFVGGMNAGCRDDCWCSVPVHKCEVCEDYDYGENDEAAEVISECALRH